MTISNYSFVVTLSLTHLIIYVPTKFVIYSHIYFLTYLFTHLFTYLLSHTLTLSCTFLLTLPLTYCFSQLCTCLLLNFTNLHIYIFRVWKSPDIWERTTPTYKFEE